MYLVSFQTRGRSTSSANGSQSSISSKAITESKKRPSSGNQSSSSLGKLTKSTDEISSEPSKKAKHNKTVKDPVRRERLSETARLAASDNPLMSFIEDKVFLIFIQLKESSNLKKNCCFMIILVIINSYIFVLMQETAKENNKDKNMVRQNFCNILWLSYCVVFTQRSAYPFRLLSLMPPLQISFNLH